MTPQELVELKQKYKEVFVLPVDDKTGYLRKPEMIDYKRAFAAMQEGGDIAFGETMLNLLWIGGDSEITSDDEYFLPARKKLIKFFDYEDAEISKDENGNTIIVINGAICKVRKITRLDLSKAERENKVGKPLVTQEKLFNIICLEKDSAFDDRNNADMRMPLYQAIEELQNGKVASIKKL
jgi:hypothetical protein